MVACPACGAHVEADFGMISCPACETVFMINIDGTVGTPNTEEPVEDILAGDEIVQESFDNTPPADESEWEDAPVAVDPEATHFALPGVDGADDFAEAAAETPSEVQSYSEEPAVEAPSEESSQDLAGSEALSEEPPTEYSEDFLHTLDANPAEKTLTDAEDPLGVTRFDGSEASQMADGPYYYDVSISGIDTAQLKQHVVDALSDKRLGWSTDEVKKMIRMGQIVLQNLNPVKAILVVLKLQTLDVDVEWEQRPYTAESSSEESEAEP